MQRSTQAAVDALMSGPVLQSETIAAFSTSAWAAQVLRPGAARQGTDRQKLVSLPVPRVIQGPASL